MIKIGNTKVNPKGLSKVMVGSSLVWQKSAPLVPVYFSSSSSGINFGRVLIYLEDTNTSKSGTLLASASGGSTIAKSKIGDYSPDKYLRIVSEGQGSGTNRIYQDTYKENGTFESVVTVKSSSSASTLTWYVKLGDFKGFYVQGSPGGRVTASSYVKVSCYKGVIPA